MTSVHKVVSTRQQGYEASHAMTLMLAHPHCKSMQHTSCLRQFAASSQRVRICQSWSVLSVAIARSLENWMRPQWMGTSVAIRTRRASSVSWLVYGGPEYAIGSWLSREARWSQMTSAIAKALGANRLGCRSGPMTEAPRSCRCSKFLRRLTKNSAVVTLWYRASMSQRHAGHSPGSSSF